VIGSIAVAAALTLLSPVAAPAATGNAVITWDVNAQTAIWDVAGQSAAAAGRSFAMVSGAVYDAVNAIAGKPYRPYLVAPATNGTESTDAAIGTAATRVLTALFPAQQDRLRTQYEDLLAAIPDGQAKAGGVRVGDQTAAAMVAARENDGAFGTELWPVGTEPGQWRPAPPGFGNSGAWAAHTRHFAIPDASMGELPGPPALTSRAYAREFNEVKEIGAASSTVRTADQTEAAIWWQDPRSVEWEIKRQVAETQGLSVLETARLFALSDTSTIDAAIACAHEKERWSSWRPITAIRLADTDGNPRTVADPAWTPLLSTSPSPDYPSGHACGIGARMTAFRLFFGRDDISYHAFSEASGTTRHFTSFSSGLAEVMKSRVWGGIHVRSANTDGAKLGKAVAFYVGFRYFQPR
jgi:hypothetical protein